MLHRVVNEFYEVYEEIGEVNARAGADMTGETSAKKLAKEQLAYAAIFFGRMWRSIRCEQI